MLKIWIMGLYVFQFLQIHQMLLFQVLMYRQRLYLQIAIFCTPVDNQALTQELEIQFQIMCKLRQSKPCKIQGLFLKLQEQILVMSSKQLSFLLMKLTTMLLTLSTKDISHKTINQHVLLWQLNQYQKLVLKLKLNALQQCKKKEEIDFNI